MKVFSSARSEIGLPHESRDSQNSDDNHIVLNVNIEKLYNKSKFHNRLHISIGTMTEKCRAGPGLEPRVSRLAYECSTD